MAKQYAVVQTSDMTEFIFRVNARLSDGWEPLGTVVPCVTSGGFLYHQAFLREKPAQQGGA